MADMNRPPEPEDLDRRLDALKKSRRKQKQERDRGNQGTAAGIAFRLVTELVVGIAVGVGIGWFLDDFLGTKPWFLILFFLLGTAAGLFNVIRAAKSIQEAAMKVETNRDDLDKDESKPGGA